MGLRDMLQHWLKFKGLGYIYLLFTTLVALSCYSGISERLNNNILNDNYTMHNNDQKSDVPTASRIKIQVSHFSEEAPNKHA